MRDGLYQVTRGGVCAGFMVEGGRVTQQAPILRARGMAGQVRRVDDFQRVLVTGSRDFKDQEAVRQDLTRVLVKWGCRPDQVVVVNGMARGLDTVARSAALELGMRVEDHPAHWDRHGKSAGHRRNAEMVAAGARGAIAYPLGESRGTRGAMKLCEAAGIPVWNRTDTPANYQPTSTTPTMEANRMNTPRDPVDVEYLDAIAVAAYYGDNDTALELQIGLNQYHELYQVDREVSDDCA